MRFLRLTFYASCFRRIDVTWPPRESGVLPFLSHVYIYTHIYIYKCINICIYSFQNYSAFFATLTSGYAGPNYAHDAIKFNDVSINIGNGYSSSTGKFTAPDNGIYQISFSYLQRSGYQSHVQLIKDGVKYTEVHANHRNYDQLSKTVLIELKKGQKVWVRLPKSSSYAIYGSGRYTTFYGYLIPLYWFKVYQNFVYHSWPTFPSCTCIFRRVNQ